MKWILSFLLANFFPHPGKIISERWVIDRTSNLCIEGKSNIASFQCDVIEYLHADTISLESTTNAASGLTIKGGIRIDINRIDCHQRYITTDLRKTLQADKIALLKIGLLSIGDFRAPGSKNVKGKVLIELAGVAKQMEVDYLVQTDPEKNLLMIGTREVLFSDFNLQAPHKLAGLVKVDDKLLIRFKLVLRSVNEKI